MKTNYLRIGLLALVVSFASCSKDDDNNSTTTETPTVMTEAEVEADIKTEIKAEDFANDFSGMYDEIPTSAGKGAVTIPDGPKICDITPTKSFSGVNLQYTYNLGNTGCSRGGKTVKGTLVISVNVLTKAITFKFTNFFQGDHKLNGEMTLTKSMVNNKRVIATSLSNLKIEISGKVITKSASYTQTQIAGGDTATEADDEFSTTGSWTTIFNDGKQNVVTISSPLITKGACKISVFDIPRFIKGTISFKIRGNMGTLDFGDGKCDSKWTLKVNNKVVEVVKL